MNKNNKGVKNALYYILVILAMVMVVYFLLEITNQLRQISSIQPLRNRFKMAKSRTSRFSLLVVSIKSLVSIRQNRKLLIPAA